MVLARVYNYTWHDPWVLADRRGERIKIHGTIHGSAGPEADPAYYSPMIFTKTLEPAYGIEYYCRYGTA